MIYILGCHRVGRALGERVGAGWFGRDCALAITRAPLWDEPYRWLSADRLGRAHPIMIWITGRHWHD